MGLSCYSCYLTCLVVLLLIIQNEPLASSMISPSSSTTSTAHWLCSHKEGGALLRFKRMITTDSEASHYLCDYYGGSYPKTNLWKEGADCCSWVGVTCDEVSGHVVELDLSCSQLRGTIHSLNSSLFLLHHLKSLNLAGNDFSGSRISSEFGRKFFELRYLNLSSSGFSGAIPAELSNLQKLEFLDLSSNEFSGRFPSIFGDLSNLSHLRISDNLPTDHIPNITRGFDSLTVLNLSGNRFNGTIPSWLFTRSSLVKLNLEDNLLTGAISPLVGSLANLSQLILADNFLSGRIPPSLFDIPLLEILDLSRNSLVGPIPSSNLTGGLQKLKYLDLSYNRLNSVIPPALLALPSLESLALAYNQLTGPIPKFQSPMLQTVRLNNNSLQGDDFSSLLNLVNLVEIHLSNNNLTGTFQLDMLLGLRNLEFIDLSYNTYLGLNSSNKTSSPLPKLRAFLMTSCNVNALPFIVTNFVRMETLDLSNNNIHGRLPEWFNKLNLSYGKHFWWYGTAIDLSFNLLNGALPGNVSLPSLDLSHNRFTSGVENLAWYKLDSLDLSSNLLYGALPGNVSLPSLDLSHNRFTSGVENLAWYKLDSLDLSFNLLGGRLPGNFSMSTLKISNNLLSSIENLHESSSLRYLDISYNSLQGAFPIPPARLEEFYISNNKLAGNIDPRICDLRRLSFLDLSENNLSGDIPDCLFKIASVMLLNLRANNLRGTIPQVVGGNLTTLDLSHNQLGGQIPRSLAYCRSLEILDLSHNLINDTFPTWLKDVVVLKALLLGSNRLHGILPKPSNASSFTELSVIDVSNNNLSGKLPSHYFQSWTSMMRGSGSVGFPSEFLSKRNFSFNYGTVKLVDKGQVMDLVRILTEFKAVDFSNNRFEGEIPESIGNLRSLYSLKLSSNRLTGHIQPSLGNLVQLQSLELSNNKLFGRIPQQLSSLTFLGVFNVSENNLEGQIPTTGQLATFSNDSYADNPGLCGIPLTKKCEKGRLSSPPVLGSVQNEDDESLLDGFTWKSVAFGYGCGAILGVLGGIVILRRHEERVLYIFNIRIHWRFKKMVGR